MAKEDKETGAGMAEAEKQQELQRKYMEFQYMEQHLGQYQKQLEKIESQFQDVKAVEEGLGDFDKKAEGDEILVPISNGIFAKAKLTDDKSLLVNVGSNIVVQKSVDGTKELLDDQRKEIDKARIQLMTVIESVTEQMQMVEKELSAAIGTPEE